MAENETQAADVSPEALAKLQTGMLIHLIEEACEVGQAATKMLRYGPYSHNPDAPEKGNNLQQLAREVGNLFMVIDSLNLPESEMQIGMQQKIDNVKKYGWMK